jgi:hypothetical protein
VVEHVSQTRRSSGSADRRHLKLRRRLPTENIYGVVTGAPSVMPKFMYFRDRTGNARARKVSISAE